MRPRGGLDTAQEKEILNGKLHFWCSVSRFPVIPYNIYVFVCIVYIYKIIYNSFDDHGTEIN